MSENPFSLAGHTVLVTGASAGLGRQTAISVSQAGARVVITGRNAEKLAATFSALTPGPEHVLAPADLTKAEERVRLAAELPALDGLVHCAGLTLLHPFKFNTERRYHEIYSINVEAPLFLTQHFSKVRKLNPAASIVFISSISPNVGTKGHSIYSGSKAAVQGISRVLAHELAPMKIRSNCVSPGMVKTEVAEGMSDQITPELLAADEARYPLGYGTPEDVANAVIFFLAPASKWITGTNLIMDGGLM
jgi:NAD(P)-dependent dehydrogenase (short-subunit alcohol dehydrogenase family)